MPQTPTKNNLGQSHAGDISPRASPDVLSTIAEEPEPANTLAGSRISKAPKSLNPPGMVRQETLETSPTQRAEHAAELSDILGNATGHLHKVSKKEQLDPEKDELLPIFWEQYSPHAQVELDIDLESNFIVQGDWLRGNILINVNPREPLLIGITIGKVRLLCLEWLSKNDERSIFYNFSSSLVAVAPGFRTLVTTELDEDGFGVIRTGSFNVPFALQVPVTSDYGRPKGCYSQHGASIRTIILVTLKVVYPASKKRSMAHFYRECTLWPRLDPQKILYTQTRPIQVTVTEDDVHLTASLYRPTWVAGQDCRVKITISNNSQTPIKLIDIGLFSTVSIFNQGEPDCMNTQISRSTLKMKQHPTPGHASAKGWWSGVKPGETRIVYHLIPIPADALSVGKGHLFEVTTFLRVILPRGLLLTNISVDLPLVIVNAHSFHRPEQATTYPLNAIADPDTHQTMTIDALRQDRDQNKSGSKIQLPLADTNDQETPANNHPPQLEQDHNNSLGFLSEHNTQSPKSLPPGSSGEEEGANKMPPPYLTNFSRRVEEKRQRLLKERALQADNNEYGHDAAELLLEDLDFGAAQALYNKRNEQLASGNASHTRGVTRGRDSSDSDNSSDSEDPEQRTARPTRDRSPSPDQRDEPTRTRDSDHHGLISTVPDASEHGRPRQSDDDDDDDPDSMVKKPTETLGSGLEDANSVSSAGKSTPMPKDKVITTSPTIVTKRLGSHREGFNFKLKNTSTGPRPSMPTLTTVPRLATSNGSATGDPLRLSSSLPSSRSSIPRFGAVKERIKALEMRKGE